MLRQIEQQLPRPLELRQRSQHALVQLVNRPLRLRVEPPDRLNLIPEKLHPHRLRLIRRKHIQNAAPYGELPHHLHRILPLITDALQMRRQIVQRDLLMHLQRQRKL